MKIFSRVLFIVGLLFLGNTVSAQFLPPSYEPLFNEIVDNFKEIRGGNSIKSGKTSSLRLLSDEKIIVRMDHKNSVKTLTFIKKLDEEGEKFWYSDNKVTTDMVNKYEKELTKLLNKFLAESRSQAKI